MADRVEIIVSVDTSRPGGAKHTAEALRTAGVHVTDVLEELGTITGSCTTEQLPVVEGTPGVLHVEQSRTIRLPPPGSPQ
jgi:hypothetical protein